MIEVAPMTLSHSGPDDEGNAIIVLAQTWEGSNSAQQGAW